MATHVINATPGAFTVTASAGGRSLTVTTTASQQAQHTLAELIEVVTDRR